MSADRNVIKSMVTLQVYLPYILLDLKGSTWAVVTKMQSEGFLTASYNMWYTCTDPMALKVSIVRAQMKLPDYITSFTAQFSKQKNEGSLQIVFGVIGLQMLLVRVVPGEKFTGPVSPAGTVLSAII